MKKETEKAKCARIEAKAIGRAFYGKKNVFLKERFNWDRAFWEAGALAVFKNRRGIKPKEVEIWNLISQ